MDQIPDLTSVDLASQVSVKVARKALDAQKQQGEAAIQLLQAAAKVQADSASGGLDIQA